MSTVSGKRLTLVALSAFAFMVLVIVGLVVTYQADRSRRNLPDLGSVPAFHALDQSGVSFTRDSLMGNVSVFAFIFTRCPGVCPVMMNQYIRLADGFAKHPEFRLVAVTVDPAHDTVSLLAEYAKRHAFELPTTRLLWMPLDSAKALLERGFALSSDGLPEGHTTKFILVDRVGVIRGYYDGTADPSVDVLISHLREMLLVRP